MLIFRDFKQKTVLNFKRQTSHFAPLVGYNNSPYKFGEFGAPLSKPEYLKTCILRRSIHKDG